MSVSKYETTRGPRYRVQIYEDGRKVLGKAGFKTKAEAKRYEALAKSDMDSFQKKPERRFSELIDHYQSVHLNTMKPNSRARYLLDINDRLLPHFQFFKLSQIKLVQIESFRSELIESSGLGPKSINGCISLLYTILKKAKGWEWIEKMPGSLPKLKEEKKTYRWWDNKTHIARFLETARANSPYAAFFEIALETGMRLGEIAGLRAGDIDFAHCRINVRQQWLHKEKDVGPLKDSEQRILYFKRGSSLEKALREAVRRAKDPNRLWLTQFGTRVSTPWIAFDHFHCLRKQAGVPRIRFHDLRHTFASWFMIEVGEIWKLKGILGHSSIATTMVYAHLGRDANQLADMGFTNIAHGSPIENVVSLFK